jgi:hypothetical protein
MSFGMMVTRLAWMAHRFVSSKRPTRYASLASYTTRKENMNEQEMLEEGRFVAKAGPEGSQASRIYQRKRKTVVSSFEYVH